jgi:hypothetical protein
MSHWAEIKEIDGQLVVQRVLVGKNGGDEGESFMNSLGGRWIKTSYNGNIRKNFAGIGYTYSEELDAFIPPKPFASWTLNEETANWNAPVAYPEDGKPYIWIEDTLSWEEVEIPEDTNNDSSVL